MKKSVKISLWIVGVLAGLVILFVTCADVAVSRIAEKKAHEALVQANLPYNIDFGRIHVLLMSGCVEVEDIHFGAKGKALKSKAIDTVDVVVPSVAIRHISYRDLIKERKVSIGTVKVRKACALLKGKGNKMNVKADSLTVEAKQLFYSLKDSTFGFCDSLYEVSLHRLQFTDAEGLTSIDANDLCTEDGGEITLGKVRIWNCVGKRELAKIKKEPSTWMDLRLKSVTISPMNPLRTDFSKGLHLEKVIVKGQHMEVLRDNRIKPTKPFPMPQQVLMSMNFPIKIDRVEFDMPKMDVGVLMTDKNLGELHLGKMGAVIHNFGTKRGNVMSVDLNAELGQGKATGTFKLHNNAECQFDMNLHGKHIETSNLNTLLRPIVAMELDCHIDSLKAKYTGNKTNASGKVMFAYHGMKGKVHKGDDIPIKIVQQNAGAIEYFMNHLIPKSNPRNESKTPLSFNVEVNRDEMQPFPFYVMKPLIIGAVETFLPGLFQGKKVKE